MRLARLLHFLGIDVEPAADDQLLGAPDEEEIAVAVEVPQVSAAHEMIRRQRLGALPRLREVAGEDGGPADLHLADVARAQRPSRLAVDDANAHPVERQADRALLALPHDRIRGGDAHLGHSVALHDRVTSALAKPAPGLDPERRRTAREQTHVREVEATFDLY